MKKPTAFQVFDRMVERNDQALKFGPLANIDGARATKHGTVITIGWPGNIVAQIGMGDYYVGGLIICERKRFEEVKAEMEKEG